MEIDFGLLNGLVVGVNSFSEDFGEGTEHNVQVFILVVCIHFTWVSS